MSAEGSKSEGPAAGEIGGALLGAAETRALVGRLRSGGREERALGAELATQRAMLEVVGERGWGATTVADVVARSGSNRARFYSSFGGKAACYASAHAAAGQALAGRLLGACAQAPDWAAGMHAALTRLARFLEEEPTIARALLVEAQAAGAAVAAEHDQVFGRLSRAMDRARRETLESRHPVPPFTSRFILDAVDAAAQRFLTEPGRGGFEEEVPGLLGLALGYYLGAAPARAEVRRLCGPG